MGLDEVRDGDIVTFPHSGSPKFRYKVMKVDRARKVLVLTAYDIKDIEFELAFRVASDLLIADNFVLTWEMK